MNSVFQVNKLASEDIKDIKTNSFCDVNNDNESYQSKIDEDNEGVSKILVNFFC